jgi:hypothetical protein
VFASLLHVLHGNRPYALSRRSHPLTPYAPTGPVEYKSLLRKLEETTALYDIASALAYDDMYAPRLRMAMKIGGEYGIEATSGRHFADTVPDHRVGLHTPGDQ